MATANDEVQVKVAFTEDVTTGIRALRTNMESEFHNINTTVKESQANFSNLGDLIKGSFINAIKAGVVAFVGFEAIRRTTQFIKDCHQAADEHRQAILQLTASLGQNVGALLDQARALEKTKLIHDDEILKADTRLSLYFKEESQVRKLIPAVIDLAKAKGVDLTTAANMVAVAFTRGENATSKTDMSVGRLGITFKKTGDDAKDLDTLITELNKKFGGQSDAAAEAKDGFDKFSFTMQMWAKHLGETLFGTTKLEQKLKDNKIAAEQLAIEKKSLARAEAAYDLVVDDQIKGIQRLWIQFNYNKGQLEDYIPKLRAKVAADEEALRVTEAQTTAISIQNLVLNKRPPAKDNTKAEQDAAKQVIEARRELERTKIELTMTGEKARLALLDLELRQELEKYKGNAVAIRAIQASYALKKETGAWSAEKQAKWEMDCIDDVGKEQRKIDEDNYNFNQMLTEHKLQNLQKVDKQEQMSQKDAAKFAIDTLGSVFKASKDDAVAYKAIEIARATMNTYEAATKALTAGPIIGEILAGIVIAAGMANVAQIASQSFQSGTPRAPGGYAMVGEQGPELAYIPRGSQIYTHNETRNMIGGSSFHLHLEGSTVDYAAVDRLEKSLPRMLETLADTNALRTFKAKLAKV